MKSALFFRFFLLIFLMQSQIAPLALAENAQPWDELESERDAKEEVDAAELSAQKEMSSSIYGRVISRDTDARTLSLLPTDDVENTDAENEDELAAGTYSFRKDSTVTGIGSFEEIASGDYITVDYYTFHGMNRILGIVFDKHGEGSSATVAPSKLPADLTDSAEEVPTPQSGSGDLVG